MVKPLKLAGPVLVVAVLCLSAYCGKDETQPETDPYKQISAFRWVSRTYETVDGQKIEIMTTFKFNEEKTYTMSRKGTASGEELESYAKAESGTYELVDDTISMTPGTGNAYTIGWEILTGSGNLQLVFPDGEVLEFEYTVAQGYA